MNQTERRSNARVLVIESSESAARIVIHSLKSARIEAQWIPLANVVNCLRTWKPQLILLGDDLDGVDGIELCAKIRTISYAPIMILTESDAIGQHVRAFDAGADDVIVRPICPPLLLARVTSQLRRSYRYSVPPQSTHQLQAVVAAG